MVELAPVKLKPQSFLVGGEEDLSLQCFSHLVSCLCLSRQEVAPLWGCCVGVLCVLWPQEKLPMKCLFFLRRDSLIVTFPDKELFLGDLLQPFELGIPLMTLEHFGAAFV